MKNICETVIPNTDNLFIVIAIRFEKCEQLNRFKTIIKNTRAVTAPLIPPGGDAKTVTSSEFPAYRGTNVVECILR